MQTDDLIDALARDAGSPLPEMERSIARSIAAGIAVAALLFFVLLGPRPDLQPSLMMSWFGMKALITLLLAVASFQAVSALARPAAKVPLWPLVAVVVLLFAAIADDLMLYGTSEALTRLVGNNARVCLTFIPILSAAPLVSALLALRYGAPTRPGLAGAAAGLFCGAVGASFYAWHCPDDSPLFVAVWYSLAIALVTAAGALLGQRVLRW